MSWLAPTLAGALLAASWSAVDATQFHAFSVAEGSFPGRTSQSPLPRTARIAYRVSVPGGIAHAPSALANGDLLVAHSQPTLSLSRYDAAGHARWTARLGVSRAATSPIGLPDGKALVFTEGGEALLLGDRGDVLWTRQLPLASFARAAAVATLGDGSVMLTSGKRLFRLDTAGTLVHATLLQEDSLALLGSPGAPLVIDISGHVASVSPDGRVDRLGKLEGRVDAVARVATNRIVAVVDGRRLVAFDLATRAARTLFEDDALPLTAALAVGLRGEARLVAASDLLLAFQRDGSERHRAQLQSSFGAPSPAAAAELTVDAEGTTLLVRPGMDASVVRVDGSVVRIDATACPDPLRPVALSGRSAVLACRSGSLTRVVEQTAQ